MGLNFFHFEDYSKSARWMILFRLVTCYHTPTLHKNAEKPTVIWFFTQILIESTVPCFYFIKKKSSFFKPPLLFCDGDSKNENFNSLQKYGVRPIKWKGILRRLTIWSQKIGQYNSVESSLKMDLIFFHHEDNSKSACWMISFWIVTWHY